MFDKEFFEKAMHNLNRCRQVSLQPRTDTCPWSPQEPTVTICMNDKPDDCEVTQEQAAQLVSKIVQHMEGAALVLRGRECARSPAAVVAALSSAPPTLTTVCLPAAPWGLLDRHFWYEDDDADGAAADDGEGDERANGTERVEAGVLRHLPATVTHVVLASSSADSHMEWLGHLRMYMKGVTRPLRLTLLHGGWFGAWDEQEVREWLSTHVGSQVQVEFQRRQVEVDSSSDSDEGY